LRIALVADEGPKLVALDPVDSQADHHSVVQLGAASPDAKRQAGDGLAVGAGEAGDSALADAFTQGTDDFDLLIARKDIHGPNPWCCGPEARDSGKVERNPLYRSEWSLLRGPIPRF